MVTIQPPSAAAARAITHCSAPPAASAIPPNPSASTRNSSPSACRWESIRGKATIRLSEGA